MRLIDDILDLSKAEAGRMELQSVEFDLNRLIGSLQTLFEVRCRSPAVQAVLEEIDLLRQAHTVSVLVTGESGRGKGGIARAIPFEGSRTKGPFVAVFFRLAGCTITLPPLPRTTRVEICCRWIFSALRIC